MPGVKEPKRAAELADAVSPAKVGNKVWICDCFMPCVWESDPSTDGKLTYRLLAGPGPIGLCAQEDSVW